ncbi:MAG: hypothetical protein H9855_13405 [Candidatus Acinetobacter avistercoris]|uniref:hypothetical protein n=1 Tax=Acinetobacter sp. KS-LM10 TaxID=3120518 RepID=UPI001F9A6B9F|nr:hypothetical protein [Candidatus Acinetobacter avistercoris]
MSPDIAEIIFKILVVLSASGIIFWLIYMTIKDKSIYEFSKENQRFIVYNLLIFSGIFAIFDFTPADSSDLRKIDQYLEKAKKEKNQDLVLAIKKIKMQPKITMKDKKYIDKLVEKDI